MRRRLCSLRFTPNGLLPDCRQVLAWDFRVARQNAHDRYATYSAVHIRVGLSRRFCELTVFDAPSPLNRFFRS
jgi:hypothetical protein